MIPITINRKQIFAIKTEREKRIAKACPGIPNSSGIYAFYRDDPSGLKMAYCGQAKSLRERCASHLGEYDHIGLSLKKRGFYSKDNPYGWKLSFKCCPVSELDNREIETIKSFGNSGYQLYNVTAGGQGKGKQKIGEYRPARSYREGVDAGYKKASREIAHLFNLHLVYKPAKDPPTQNQLKAAEKFKTFLEYHLNS